MGLVDGGTDGDISGVPPLHIQKGTLPDPPHVSSLCFLQESITAILGETNPVLPHGATSPVTDLVEMEEKSCAGVEVIHIHVVACIYTWPQCPQVPMAAAAAA